MRSIGCILVILIYISCFNLYLYELPRHNWAIEHCKIFYNAITVVMITFCLVDSRIGFESQWHSEFNLICSIVVIINFIIIILTHLTLISDPILYCWIFNGSVFVVSLMVLISGGRHHEFNE